MAIYLHYFRLLLSFSLYQSKIALICVRKIVFGDGATWFCSLIYSWFCSLCKRKHLVHILVKPVGRREGENESQGEERNSSWKLRTAP